MGFFFRIALAIVGVLAALISFSGFLSLSFGVWWEFMEDGGYLWLSVVGFFMILLGTVLALYSGHLSEKDKRVEDFELEKEMRTEESLETLKMRYAKGEIKTKQYKEMKKVLEAD